MWQRFTERARRVVFCAQSEALARRETLVSPEHLLLGLLQEQDSVAGRTLTALGLSATALYALLEEQLPPRKASPAPSDLQQDLAPHSKRVIELAYDEAQQLAQVHIGTEHFLLGLLRESSGPAGTLLARQGLTLEALRATIQQLQDEPSWARLTERARRVLSFAQEEARQLGQGTIATEHLLLGLTRESDTVAASVLTRLGFTLPQVRRSLERHLVRGAADMAVDPQLGHTGKRVLALAFEEAQRLKNDIIGTEHLLLGLLREGSGLAGHTLSRLGISLEAARTEVKALQAPPPPALTPALPQSPAVQALFSQITYEAQQLGERYASTEHLLLVVVQEPDAAVVAYLAAFQVTPQDVLRELTRQLIRNVTAHTDRVTLTPRALRALELAYDEAQKQGVSQIEPVHLLLGLLREQEGMAGRILTKLGLSLTPTTLSPDALAARLLALGAEALRLAPYLAELPAEEFRAALLGDEPESLL